MTLTFIAARPDIISVLDHHRADEDDAHQDGQGEGSVEKLGQIFGQAEHRDVIICISVLDVTNNYVRIRMIFKMCLAKYCMQDKIEKVNRK